MRADFLTLRAVFGAKIVEVLSAHHEEVPQVDYESHAHPKAAPASEQHVAKTDFAEKIIEVLVEKPAVVPQVSDVMGVHGNREDGFC